MIVIITNEILFLYSNNYKYKFYMVFAYIQISKHRNVAFKMVPKLIYSYIQWHVRSSFENNILEDILYIRHCARCLSICCVVHCLLILMFLSRNGSCPSEFHRHFLPLTPMILMIARCTSAKPLGNLKNKIYYSQSWKGIWHAWGPHSKVEREKKSLDLGLWLY